MKHIRSTACFFLGMTATLAAALPGRAASILWTNTAAGYWSVTNNWSPNQIPGAVDTAILPASATNGVIMDTNVTLQNLIVEGGDLTTTGYSYATLTVNGQIDWTNGILGCVLTNNGAMLLAGTDGVDYTLAYPFYNAGTFTLLSGNLLINYCGYNSGALFNLAGALIDIQNDASIDLSSNNFGLCVPVFSNAGTIRKSGGAGVTRLNVPLSNTGAVDAQTGAISFSGGGDLNGTLQTEGSASMILASNIIGNNQDLALDGNLNSTNAFLEGANLVGNGTIHGVLNWVSGTFATGDGALTIGTNGALILAHSNGVDYTLSGVLYNEGVLQLAGGNLLINYCGSDDGRLYNQPGGLIDIASDVMIDSLCGGELDNQGIVRKSGGTGVTDIGAYFNNAAGIVDAQTGVIGLTNNYNLSGGTLNFGINSLSSYGQIFLAGSPALSGGLSVNLNNGYTPAPGSAFPLLSYGSETGAFSPLVLPSWINWQTNYGPTNLTLAVLNDRPAIGANVSYLNHQFTLEFEGGSNLAYTVLATTNLALPLANWSTLGPATLISNNLFQFIDGQTTNYPERFYELRLSP